jgi:hypothetical protein
MLGDGMHLASRGSAYPCPINKPILFRWQVGDQPCIAALCRSGCSPLSN